MNRVLSLTRHTSSWFFGMVLCFQFSSAQLMELDFTSEKREESSFRIHLLRSGIIGVSSLKHFDITAELLKFRYDTQKGMYWGLSIFGTRTLWKGNKNDALNTFDYLMNPLGGNIHWNLFSKIPLKRTQIQNSNVGLSLGSRWIQGPPLPNNQNTSFLDHYLRLGWVHQRLLAEEALTNSSLYLWAFPHLQIHQSSAESRLLFFNNQIEPQAFGYGMEIGLEYNRQFKVTLHGQQLTNTDPQGDFNRFVARLVVAYQF